MKLYQEVPLQQIFEDFGEGSEVGLVDLPSESPDVVVIPQGQTFPIKKSIIPRIDFYGPPPPSPDAPPPPPDAPPPPIPQFGELKERYNVIFLNECTGIYQM